MNILVVGLGSMGKRRIRLLKRFEQVGYIIGVDKREDRREEVLNSYGCKVYDNIEKALSENQDVECAFVCTSPRSHSNLITKILNQDLHVFTEINLVRDGYQKNIALAKNKKRILFLSSTFLYREEIKFIYSHVKNLQGLNYIYHVGQYLPDWHPWENYSEFFVNDKKTNGCRELMAIEFPWIVKTFGEIKDIQMISDNISNLQIHYNDNYMMIMAHKNGNKGVLVVDVVSPKAVRNLEIYGENIYYSWNGTPESLEYYCKEEKKIKSLSIYDNVDHVDGYSSFVVENAYQNEIQAFFDAIEKNIYPPYGFENDLEILNLIDQIEEACYE